MSNKNLNKEILYLLCNYIAGSEEVTEMLLFMMNPDTIVQFVTDNIHSEGDSTDEQNSI